MKRTRINRLLQITYPILQGGMLWLANAKLAAAVSNAGGFGIISPFAGMEKYGDGPENLKYQLKQIRELTDKPFGINILMNLDQTGILFDTLLHENVKVIITAAGHPSYYTQLLKSQGIKVLHVISSVKQALVAEDEGVDAVIAEGVEAAGHNGHDELPLISLIPQVVDAVSIPVIAAGGIADSRGVAAVMALGAEGVQLGTRFIAVDENIAHPRYKQAILNATDSDTVITCRKILPTRMLKTPFSSSLLELENSGASPNEIREFLGYSRARKGQLEGDLEEGITYCGSSAGLIKSIDSADRVLRNLMAGYDRIIADLVSDDHLI